MCNRAPEAMIFDLDGVITLTARVHAAAWKELFDQYLKKRAPRSHQPFREFTESDYLNYVDGKPRYDGVASFLASRGIEIAYGTPSDPPGVETVCGLGNQKDELFLEKVRELGVDVDEEAVRLVRELREQHVRVGVASSSRNAVPILERAGLKGMFHAIVDGVISERVHLRGKPEPDIFLRCLTELTSNGNPENAGIAEDAIAGVEAGQRGGFGLVLGVDRRNTGLLEQNGANLVIRNFSEIDADRVFTFFANRARAA
jgi:HAD superfamily hydrolase (TIGR01509 family)